MNIQDLPLENQYKILLSLPPQKALKLCQTNLYFASLCNNADFWIYRSYEEFGVTADVFNDTDLPPRLRYLQLLSTVGNKCVPGSERFVDENTCAWRTARDNDIDSLDYFFKNPNNNKSLLLRDALLGAAEGNNLDLLEHIIKSLLPLNNQFVYELRRASISSIKNKNLNMFKYLSALFQSQEPEKYKSFLNKSLFQALKYNSVNIINYLNSLGIQDPNMILKGAAYANNMPLIQKAIINGANDYKAALLEAVAGNNIGLVNYFFKFVPLNSILFIEALNTAAFQGNPETFIHIINMIKESELNVNISNWLDNFIVSNIDGYTNINFVRYILDNLWNGETLNQSIQSSSFNDVYNNILKLVTNKSPLDNTNKEFILSVALWNSIKNNQPLNKKYLLSIGAKIYPSIYTLFINKIGQKDLKVLEKVLQERLLSKQEINNLLELATKIGNNEMVNILLSVTQ